MAGSRRGTGEKKALVTGATGGIGEAIAATLKAAGASVAVSGTNPEKLSALAANYNTIACNLSDAAAVAELPVDWALVPVEGRRKKLLVADMDSTIINVECLDELADFAGIKSEIAAITERAMRGELEFEPALRERRG